VVWDHEVAGSNPVAPIALGGRNALRTVTEIVEMLGIAVVNVSTT
jgi:hypothetical protein